MTTEEIAFFTGLATLISGTIYKVCAIISTNCSYFKCIECQSNKPKDSRTEYTIEMSPV